MSNFKRMLCVMSIVLMLFLAGCGATTYVSDEESMFVPIEEHTYWGVVAHRDTGVMYLVGREWESVSVMLNPDGTPMVWRGINDK